MRDLSAYLACPGVILRWGTATVARYAGFDDDVSVGGVLFNSAPEFECDEIVLSADMEDRPVRFWLGSSRPPGPTLLRPYAHAEVTAELGDLIMVPGLPNVWQPLVTATVADAAADERGRPGLAQYTAAGPKALFGGRLSLPVMTDCRWHFGDASCGVPRDEQTGAITAVNGRAITTSGLSTPATVGTSYWWEMGDVTVDGLTLMIVRHVSDTVFELRSAPPPEWAGQSGTFRNGCRKTPEDCDLKYSNISNYGGLALGMSNRNPLIDEA